MQAIKKFQDANDDDNDDNDNDNFFLLLKFKKNPRVGQTDTRA